MAECIQPYYIKDGNLLECSSFNMEIINVGKSIYEVARLSGNNILFLEDHLERFFYSLRLDGIKSWLGKNEIRSILNRLIHHNLVKEGNIKFVINIRSEENRHFVAYFVRHKYPSPEQYHEGVKISTFPFERIEPNKKIWRPEFRREIADFLDKKQVFEALLVDSDNCVPEASRSNVFAVINNAIITPSDDLVLPGITRKYVLKVCKELGIPVEMRTIRMEEIDMLDGLFLTGTSIHVLPVCQVNEIRLPVENDIMHKIINQFQKIINS